MSSRYWWVKVSEMCYTEVTIAIELKMKQHVTDITTNKYTFQKLPMDEQKTGIRNGLHPVHELSERIESDLGKMFKQSVSNK